MTNKLVARFRRQRIPESKHYEHYWELLEMYVDSDTPVGAVGIPGFFSQLGRAIGGDWTFNFAIEGQTMPLLSLQIVAKLDPFWFGPFPKLPADVLLVVRDIDSAYQEYGFRDEWMFKAVWIHLRQSGYQVEEITE